jgi:Brp/Blh family beta-carotene 15,15'-monooxygenase
MEIFYLIIFAIIFKVSTLIWGFTIYFILWHSIPSLFEQITFIYGDFNKNNIFNYIKNALPYWVISIIGLIVVFQIFKEEKLLYAIVFSFIAAVTFPHSLVITKMFKHKKTQPN